MPKVVDPSEQRAHIRAAARVVFARRGVAGTGLGHIAAEAGISRTGIYHYYADKEALVRDLAKELLVEEERLFEEALRAPGDVTERVAHLADGVLDRFAEWAHVGRPMLEMWAQETRRLRPLLRRLRETLATLIAEGQQKGELDKSLRPGETAALLIALIDGLMLQVLVDPAGLRPSKAMHNALAGALRRILHAERSR